MVWPRFSAARLAGLAVAAIVMLSPVAARGQYTWTGNANRTWDTSSLNWTLGSGNIAWVTSNPAVFGATGAGAVAVSGTQTVTGTGLTVNAAGYSFTGGTITLGSATTTFNIANDTTIGSVVAGSNQLVKTGAGTLTFTGANTYSGLTTVSDGVLKIATNGPTSSGGYVNNGTIIFGGASGAAYSSGRNVSGAGNVIVSDGVTVSPAAWTYTGTTSVIGGGVAANSNLNLSGTNPLASSVIRVTGGWLLNGNQTSGNDGVSNRINPAATLTLGGTAGSGDFRMGGLSASASGSTHSQSLASLSVGFGINRLYRHGTTGTASMSFTDAAGSAYARGTGGVLNIATGNEFSVSFSNVPTAAVGSGSAAVLPGAVYGDNFVGFSGAGPFVVAAPSYVDTGAATWTSNANMNVTGNVSPGAATTVNSIRFGAATAYTVTLPSGTSVIGSGMIMNASTGANAIVTGGTITSGLSNADGVNELLVFDRRGAEGRNNTGFTVNSTIVDNGAQRVVLTLSSAQNQASVSVGSVVLGGSNDYTGGTVISGVVAKFASDAAFGRDPGSSGAAVPTIRVVANANGVLSGIGLGGGLRPTVTGTYTWNANRTIEITNASFTLDPMGATDTTGGVFIMPARIQGSGILAMPLNRAGTLIITGSNTLSGFIDISNGALRADEGLGLSSNANLRFGGNNNLSSVGYLETSGTFVRPLGTAANAVQWANASLAGRGQSGFSCR